MDGTRRQRGKGLRLLAILALAVIGARLCQGVGEGGVDAVGLQLRQDDGADERNQTLAAYFGVSLMRLRRDRRLDEGQPLVEELGHGLLGRLDIVAVLDLGDQPGTFFLGLALRCRFERMPLPAALAGSVVHVEDNDPFAGRAFFDVAFHFAVLAFSSCAQFKSSSVAVDRSATCPMLFLIHLIRKSFVEPACGGSAGSAALISSQRAFATKSRV
ncbi:hypothetical protein [Mesorhizobium tamadayense]|uniref:hypothetical protein n=1 Tax=Mesorhizobium tamadayense TaxID=425306 RepID=UPI00197F237D|nr:hypothetical protein [Mesorhizobium tamadayense]